MIEWIRNIVFNITTFFFPKCSSCASPVSRFKADVAHLKAADGIIRMRLCKECSAILEKMKMRKEINADIRKK